MIKARPQDNRNLMLRVRLNKEEFKRLHQIAKDEGTNVSVIMRAGLELYDAAHVAKLEKKHGPSSI